MYIFQKSIRFYKKDIIMKKYKNIWYIIEIN